MTNVPEREAEPVFCSECQNEVDVAKGRLVDGQVLCPADLAKRPFFDRLRARKLPENYKRRSGRTFQSLFTSIAALMLVVGIAFVWRAKTLPTPPPRTLEPAAWEAVEGERPVTAPTPVVGIPAQIYLIAGVCMLLGAIIIAVSGALAGDALDLLLDISAVARRTHR